MGQRILSTCSDVETGNGVPPAAQGPQLAVFLTDLGWCGLLGAGRTLWRLQIGHVSADEVRAALLRECTRTAPPAAAEPPPSAAFGQSAVPVEADWFPELRQRLERYAQGQRVEFDDVAVLHPPQTEFQRRVTAATRRLRYGQTASYGQLALEAGSPRAARSAGSVMAANLCPVVIPCHRVLAAGGKLGGFSAPQGVALKERMLAMESGGREAGGVERGGIEHRA